MHVSVNCSIELKRVLVHIISVIIYDYD